MPSARPNAEPTPRTHVDTQARTLSVVLHDVAPPTWDACRRLLAQLATIGEFPVTLLVVPSFHGAPRNPAFERWLQMRASAGDEVVLHGYTHRDESPRRGWADRWLRSVYTRGEGEFFALSQAEAAKRIEAGLRWLKHLRLEPTGFVAPAWLLGGPAWAALRRFDFSYTCTLRRIHLLPGEQALVCQSQVYSTSTRWRQHLSVLWNGTLALWQRRQPNIRIELHPGDADAVPVRRSWQRLLKRQAQSRDACTLGELAMRLRTQTTPI